MTISIFSVITIKPSPGDTSLTGSPLSPGEVITIPLEWLTGTGTAWCFTQDACQCAGNQCKGNVTHACLTKLSVSGWAEYVVEFNLKQSLFQPL